MSGPIAGNPGHPLADREETLARERSAEARKADTQRLEAEGAVYRDGRASLQAQASDVLRALSPEMVKLLVSRLRDAVYSAPRAASELEAVLRDFGLAR